MDDFKFGIAGDSEVSYSGSITSLNTDQVERETKAFIEKLIENGKDSFTINAENLQYISSAGFRILLKFKKEYKVDITITEVNDTVANAFNVTGMDTIFNVEKKLREISVNGCERIGVGASGEVFKLDADTIVKVFSKNTRDDEIEWERCLAHESFLAGIPTAIAYDVVKVGDRKGTIFEMINARTLSEEITASPEKFDEYAGLFTELLKQVHTTEVSQNVFPSIKELYRSYFKGIVEWFDYEQINMLNKILESLPDSNTLIHGDYHPRNIMCQKDELMLIDMGNVSYGHPVFDFIAMSVSMPVLARSSEELGQQFIQIPGNMIVPFWRKVLSLYFNVSDEKEIDRLDNLFCKIGRLKRAVAPVVAAGAGEELLNACIADAKETLFDAYDELISVKWDEIFR